MSGVDPLIRVTVVREDGHEFEALTRGEGRRIELHPVGAGLPALLEGEQLGLRRPVANDAMYVEPVVVANLPAGAGEVVLEAAGSRQRNQQRDHVRVSLSTLDMELVEVPPDDVGSDEGPRDLAAQVLDISAGGARIQHVGPVLGSGTRWRASSTLAFEDGSEVDITTLVEVRWSFLDGNDLDGEQGDDEDGDEGQVTIAMAGLRFLDLRPAAEERVTRWVFQQQAKLLRIRRNAA